MPVRWRWSAAMANNDQRGKREALMRQFADLAERR
jgi:hypothetical protein